jgi:hypothetical protein
MTDLRRASRLAALLVSSAITVVACVGSAATATPTPVADVTASPEPTPTPEPTPVVEATPQATPEATPAGALPSFDLSSLTGAIPGVDSYRTSFSVGGVEQYRSVVVTKPELSKAITLLDSGEVGTRFIVIGTKAWMATGAAGAFESVPEAVASSMLLAFDPTAFISAYVNLDWAGSAADQGTEQKNGITARHLRIDSTTPAGVAEKFPSGAALDIWVAEQGFVVAWETTGFATGEDVAIEISGVNDPANKVEAPG